MRTSELEEDGFGSFPAFRAFVAETKDDFLVGYALFYYTYSTWEGRSICVDDLYVTPSHRCQGIGSRLWKKMIQAALDVKCTRCNLFLLKSDTPGIAFFEKEGAMNLSIAEGWETFTMDKDAMEAFLKVSKNTDGVNIREAKRKDCSGIRKLIQDLADYEKMPEGPQIDAKTLQEDSFGEMTFYKAFVAEEADTLVGYVLFFYTYSLDGRGVYMEDLYISPTHRSRGIGSALWRKVVQAGIDAGGCRCSLSVLNWNTPSIEFYKLKGATNLTQEKGYQFYRMIESVMKKYAKE
ncbi:thialysine N-epsilon-acetyltransferase isoform X2 [Cherax quadricarinatus]|uniref:thialysine N-epsilon-acetyltransferase isoform X2 n=1 Tax=Cherax quadricarinatus TaxID=27406 RepID=UPI00387EC0F7